MKKTIVGSSIKALNKAKINGSMNLKHLAIITVINKLKTNSGLNLSNEILLELDRINREITYSNKDICNYRQDNAYTSVSDNLFLTNVVDSSNLYTVWLNRGNVGTIEEFLDLLLKDEDLKLELNNW